MRKTRVALLAALLGLLAGRAQAAELHSLPATLPPVPGEAAPAPQPPPHDLAAEDAPESCHGLLAPWWPHHSFSCWEHVCAWFSYRPCRVTNLGYQHVPYNPQPPLYAYFLYPPVVDGPGHLYPCCSHPGWSQGYCPNCQHPLQPSPDQHAGLDH